MNCGPIDRAADDQRGGQLAAAALAGWLDVAPGHDEDFNAWYDEEHLPERMAVPGFLRGRRFEAVGGDRWRYFTLYEARDAEVFRSPAYLERLQHPTPRTRAMGPLIRSRRGAYLTQFTFGARSAEWMLVMRLSPVDPTSSTGSDGPLAAVMDLPGVLAGHILRLTPEVTGARAATEEGASNPAPVEEPHDLAILECAEARVMDHVATMVEPATAAAPDDPATLGRFRLRRQLVSVR